jgi:hypothetical protein
MPDPAGPNISDLFDKLLWRAAALLAIVVVGMLVIEWARPDLFVPPPRLERDCGDR